MKRKTSRRYFPSRAAKIGIALVVLPIAAPLMFLSFFFGALFYDDVAETVEGGLLSAFHGKAPAVAIFAEREIADASISLFLGGWSQAGNRHCLSLAVMINRPNWSFGYSGFSTKTDCVIRERYPPYSIEQFWWRSTDQPISVAYGYSGGAAAVEVSWGDGESTVAKPENGVYLTHSAKNAEPILSVDFYDLDGALLFRLPDFAKKGRGGK